MNRALELAKDIPHLTPPDIAWDSRPNEWAHQAGPALDTEFQTPGPNPYALDKVQRNA